MSGSQKFISRNRAPRVQIEYDVELYGASKKVQLPFVMGVMSDLSGKSEVPKGSVDDRKFLETDIDNFDQRMKAMKPRAAFSVPNTLSGEGNLSVDLVFEKMSDFSPAEIARKVEPLRKLLEARTQLENLMTYMDGKAGAEELIERLVGNPDQLRALALGAGKAEEQESAFDAMKAAASEAVKDQAPDTSVEDALSGMANMALPSPPEADDSADILAGMAAAPVEEAPVEDTSADVLAGLAKAAPEEAAPDTSVNEALAGMAAEVVEDTLPEDTSADVLASLAEDVPEEEDADTSVEDALAGMAAEVVGEAESPDKSADILADMAELAPDETPENTTTQDALAGMAADVVEDVPEEDISAGVLAGLAEDAPDEAPEDTKLDDTLAELAADVMEEGPEDDGVDDLLADMAEEPVDLDLEEEAADDILADMAEDSLEDVLEEDEDMSADILSDLADSQPEEPLGEDDALDILADLAEDAPEDESADEGLDDLLAEMADDAPEEEEEDDGLEDLLGGMAEAVQDEDDEDDGLDDMLAGMAEDALPEEEADEGGLQDVLSDMAQDVSDDEDEDDGLEDLLAGMADDAPENDDEDSGLEDLLGGIADAASDEEDADNGLDDLLAGMAEDTPEEDDEDAGLEDLLGSLAEAAPDEDDADGLDDLLAGMAEDAPEEDDEDGGLEDLLGSMTGTAFDNEDDEDGLDDLLAGMTAEDDDEEEDGLGDLLGGIADDEDEDGLDDLLAGLAEPEATPEDDDLDALLANDDDDLDDLLSDAEDDADDDLDALLATDDDDDDLADLLGNIGEDDALSDLLGDDDALGDLEIDDDDDTPAAPPAKPKKPTFKPDFGSMSAAKVQFESGTRRKFRIAVLGDFSGRGNKGDLEIGAALGKRKAFKLDFDTMEDVIMRFRTTLTLPLGNDGSAVEVELNELDDLHPDELFENVELFNELNMLRRDLKSGRNFDQNVERMKAWGGEFGDFKALSKKRSKGADAPADLRLTDFQSLIGDETPKPEASAASDLISRIIGPHIVAAADNGSEAMIAAVDAALSTAMSSVLHHPDFQTVEAAWRSIELLGRRVEASAELEVVVYDVSVEEFTADLAAQDDASQSGLYDMLVEKPMMDESGGPISAVIGLYTWEETPTHAELLARMARISAQMDAPFISAISTGFMGIKPEDRHPLVKKTWDALGEMPEAKYLGLASPRFMLRMPYGKKTEPVDRFDYEEFTVKEGMRSMLMANPALLVAVLLAETKARQGGDMSLGSIMSLNDMPFHYMTDQYGDQVALPCTERLLNVSGAAEVVARGFMPVISVQGQNMVKLASFQAVGGGELLGIWSGDAAKDMKSGKARMETGVGISSGAKQVGAPPKPAATPDAGGGGDEDLDYGFDSDLGGDDDDMDLGLGDDDLDLDLDMDLDLGLDDDDGMDDLLAGFGDDDDDDDDDMDADLAALLGDL